MAQQQQRRILDVFGSLPGNLLPGLVYPWRLPGECLVDGLKMPVLACPGKSHRVVSLAQQARHVVSLVQAFEMGRLECA